MATVGSNANAKAALSLDDINVSVAPWQGNRRGPSRVAQPRSRSAMMLLSVFEPAQEERTHQPLEPLGRARVAVHLNGGGKTAA